jgi:hypothetical protein
MAKKATKKKVEETTTVKVGTKTKSWSELLHQNNTVKTK